MQWRKSVDKTLRCLQQPSGIIYEAAFLRDGVLVFCDILTFDRGKVHFYEVKSSARKTPQHISDVALQYWVLSACGFEELRCSLMTLNSAYVREGELNLNLLFNTEELTATVRPMQEETGLIVDELRRVVRGSDVPEVTPGAQCFGSVPCDFLSQCWNMDQLSKIRSVPGLSPEQILNAYRAVRKAPKNSPGPEGFNQIQQKVWNVQNGSSPDYINEAYFKSLFASLEWPVAFYDVEWFMPPWPLWNGHKPFEHLPFLYSLLILNKPEEAFSEDNGYLIPGRSPAEWKPHGLGEQLDRVRTLVVFDSKGEEKSFDMLLGRRPDVRIVDMSEWLQKGHLIVSGMNGTLGLKSLVSFAGRSAEWQKLSINGGYRAAMEYLSLFNSSNLFQSEESKANLIQYCREDTMLMLAVFRKLHDAMSQ